MAKGHVLWRRVKFEVLSSVAKGQLKFCGEGSSSVAKCICLHAIILCKNSEAGSESCLSHNQK